MRSSTIVLAVGLLAAPLALLTSPDNTAIAAGFPQLIADAGVSNTADGRKLVDAPVPDALPTGTSPASRVDGAGSPLVEAGPPDSTPFSSTPSGMLPDREQVASANRVGADATAAPNLSK